MLVVGARAVVPVKPLPWPGADPRLLLLAEIEGRAGLEPVVELSPAAVYRPGAVFTMRAGRLVRMRFEPEAKLPDDLFPIDDEFPAGVDCAAKPGTIIVTTGALAERGKDDSDFDVTRSLYRADGARFELVRRTRLRIGIDPAATRRWPELRGNPFVSCAKRVE